MLQTMEILSYFLCLLDFLINTNCNFGGVSRRGTNNMFHKLQGKLGKQLIGVGCAAHIIHNAIQTAADCLPIDIECIIVKI